MVRELQDHAMPIAMVTEAEVLEFPPDLGRRGLSKISPRERKSALAELPVSVGRSPHNLDHGRLDMAAAQRDLVLFQASKEGSN